MPSLLAVQSYILHAHEDVGSCQILSAGQILVFLDSIINAASCTACSAMSGPTILSFDVAVAVSSLNSSRHRIHNYIVTM